MLLARTDPWLAATGGWGGGRARYRAPGYNRRLVVRVGKGGARDAERTTTEEERQRQRETERGRTNESNLDRPDTDEEVQRGGGYGEAGTNS